MYATLLQADLFNWAPIPQEFSPKAFWIECTISKPISIWWMGIMINTRIVSGVNDGVFFLETLPHSV